MARMPFTVSLDSFFGRPETARGSSVPCVRPNSRMAVFSLIRDQEGHAVFHGVPFFVSTGGGRRDRFLTPFLPPFLCLSAPSKPSMPIGRRSGAKRTLATGE